MIGPAEKDWTVLIYAGGVNNLDGFLKKNLEQLAHEPLPASLDVMVRHIDQRGQKDDLHLSAQGLQPLGPSVSDVNSASPAEFAEFLQLGIRKYPARHYLVVVSSHGRGAEGVVEDELHHSMISPGGFKEGLEAARRANGDRPVDAVFFDACRMMAVEMMTEMSGSAKVVIGSIDRVSGEGYGYAEILRTTGLSGDGHELGERLVALQEKRQLEACNSLSAVDLERLEPLKQALSSFSRELCQLDPEAAQRVRQISLEARRSTPSPSFLDGLDQMANYILDSYPKSKDELKDWLEMTMPGDPVSILSLCRHLLDDQQLMSAHPRLRASTQAVAVAHDHAVFSDRANDRDERPGGLSLLLPVNHQPAPPPGLFESAIEWQKAVEIIVPEGVPPPPRHTWLEAELGLP